jgi:uncharacterized membrane protein
MEESTESNEGSSGSNSSAQETRRLAKTVTLIVATAVVLALIVLAFYGFLLAPLSGHPMPAPWNSYSFFVLFEIVMTLAFGALFQGLLLLRRREPKTA